MEIFTNHFYEKGHSHSVCQDYALSLINKDYAFFVVSDGCGSAPNSEIGSMILANAFKATFENFWTDEICIETSSEILKKEILKRSDEVRKTLELLPENLYATLLFCCYDKKSKTFQLAAWGDGLFVVLYNDGSYEIIEMKYSNNAPFYISYDTDPVSVQNYIKSFGGELTLSRYKLDSQGVRLYKNEIFYNSPRMISFKNLNNDKDIKGVLAFSDGVQSFSEHFLSVINKCIDFKKINETFIERRIKRVLKEKQKDGDMPYDDISCAGIILK